MNIFSGPLMIAGEDARLETIRTGTVNKSGKHTYQEKARRAYPDI